MSKSKLPEAPWAWRSFGGELILIADHGRRDVILAGGGVQVLHGDHEHNTPSCIVTRDENGILKPITADMPIARAIVAIPDLIAALQALGVKPDGYCFCHDAIQVVAGHTGECRDACAVLAKIEGKEGRT